MKNLDNKVVKGFGDEWKRFDQESLSKSEHEDLFMRYFHIFPFEKINTSSIGFDMGCGSGRWAKKIAQFVQTLHCIDPSKEALETAKIHKKRNKKMMEDSGFENLQFSSQQPFWTVLGYKKK